MSLCCWLNWWKKLCFCSQAFIVVGGIGVLVLIWLILRRRKVAIHVRDFKKDLVYLFQIPTSQTIVSLSPFCLKLETWLRLKKVPYESIRSTSKWSKHGQVPFVEFNGEHLADTNIIIGKLQKKFETHDDLTAEQHSISRAFIMMLENQTLFSYVYYRYVEVPSKFFKSWPFWGPIKQFLASKLAPREVKKRVQNHGIGRHSVQEIYDFGMQDIQALSDFLGSKSFMMGDKMSTIDCVAFAHLCQLLYVPIDYPHTSYLKKNCSNLVAYVDRIKTDIWPDWEEVCEKHMFDS